MAAQARPAVGARVTLRALVSRPELNGTTGTVSGVAMSSGRLLVALDGSARGSAPLALRPESLEVSPTQAGACDGTLHEPEGRLLSLLLDEVVISVSRLFDHEGALVDNDVYKLRNSGPAGIARVGLLTARRTRTGSAGRPGRASWPRCAPR